MSTTDGSLGLATGMWAMSQFRIFTFSWAMTTLLARMDSALQALLADLSTGDGCRPAGLVLEHLLTTHTCLLNEVRTFWTGLLVAVAVVLSLWMTAGLWPPTLVRARWWPRTAWLRRVEDRACAITSDFLKYRLSAASASSSVAQILTEMFWITTCQRLATGASTDVLCFKILLLSGSVSLRLLLSCETHRGVLLTWTTALTALVAPAVQESPADTHTLWPLFHALVADSSRGGPSTAAVDGDNLETWVAVAFVALHLTLVATG